MAGGLSEAGELEAARANARAGGPVSERDAEWVDLFRRQHRSFCGRRNGASARVGDGQARPKTLIAFDRKTERLAPIRL